MAGLTEAIDRTFGTAFAPALKRWKGDRKKARKLREAIAALPVPPDIQGQIAAVLSEIDFYWADPTKQAFLPHLILEHSLKRTVEIGVYTGGSLVPQIVALKHTGGIVIGIDPYSDEAAVQKDNREILDNIDPVGLSPDRDRTYNSLLALLERHGLSAHSKIHRMTSNDAAALVEDDVDLIHIDGNHDFDRVMDDLVNYLPKLRVGGFLVMDDIDWPAITPLYDLVKRQMRSVYQTPGWGCCQKQARDIELYDPRG